MSTIMSRLRSPFVDAMNTSLPISPSSPAYASPLDGLRKRPRVQFYSVKDSRSKKKMRRQESLVEEVQPVEKTADERALEIFRKEYIEQFSPFFRHRAVAFELVDHLWHNMQAHLKQHFVRMSVRNIDFSADFENEQDEQGQSDTTSVNSSSTTSSDSAIPVGTNNNNVKDEQEKASYKLYSRKFIDALLAHLKRNNKQRQPDGALKSPQKLRRSTRSRRPPTQRCDCETCLRTGSHDPHVIDNDGSVVTIANEDAQTKIIRELCSTYVNRDNAESSKQMQDKLSEQSVLSNDMTSDSPLSLRECYVNLDRLEEPLNFVLASSPLFNQEPPTVSTSFILQPQTNSESWSLFEQPSLLNRDKQAEEPLLPPSMPFPSLETIEGEGQFLQSATSSSSVLRLRSDSFINNYLESPNFDVDFEQFCQTSNFSPGDFLRDIENEADSTPTCSTKEACAVYPLFMPPVLPPPPPPAPVYSANFLDLDDDEEPVVAPPVAEQAPSSNVFTIEMEVKDPCCSGPTTVLFHLLLN